MLAKLKNKPPAALSKLVVILVDYASQSRSKLIWRQPVLLLKGK